MTGELEALGSPGLFLAGEVTAHALIKTAIEQGQAVAAEVARRLQTVEDKGDEILDLCIVGAGPAGLGAAWRLHELGHTEWSLYESTSHAGGLASSVVAGTRPSSVAMNASTW